MGNWRHLYYYLVAANINRNIHLSYWVVAHEKNLAVYIETFLASPSTGGLLRYEYCLRWVFTIWLSTLVLTGLEIIFAHEPCTSSAVRRYFRNDVSVFAPPLSTTVRHFARIKPESQELHEGTNTTSMRCTEVLKAGMLRGFNLPCCRRSPSFIPSCHSARKG